MAKGQCTVTLTSHWMQMPTEVWNLAQSSCLLLRAIFFSYEPSVTNIFSCFSDLKRDVGKALHHPLCLVRMISVFNRIRCNIVFLLGEGSGGHTTSYDVWLKYIIPWPTLRTFYLTQYFSTGSIFPSSGDIWQHLEIFGVAITGVKVEHYWPLVVSDAVSPPEVCKTTLSPTKTDRAQMTVWEAFRSPDLGFISIVPILYLYLLGQVN